MRREDADRIAPAALRMTKGGAYDRRSVAKQRRYRGSASPRATGLNVKAVESSFQELKITHVSRLTLPCSPIVRGQGQHGAGERMIPHARDVHRSNAVPTATDRSLNIRSTETCKSCACKRPFGCVVARRGRAHVPDVAWAEVAPDGRPAPTTGLVDRAPGTTHLGIARTRTPCHGS